MFELRLLCPETEVETISEALQALDALSVSVEDADAQTDAEQPLFGEPGMPAPKEGWQRSLITALFNTQDAARDAMRLLQAQDFFAGSRVLGIEPLPDQDWVRLTQSQFTPVAITDDFWIVPSWHEAPAHARHVIRLDPGLAFGTGTHPTTCMCLRWLARHANAHTARVLQQLRRTGADGAAVPRIVFTKGGGQWLAAMRALDCDVLGVDWTVNLGAARQLLQSPAASDGCMAQPIQQSLQGNLDPAVLFAPPAAIEAEVQRTLAAFGAPDTTNDPGKRSCQLIFNLGHGIKQNTPPEHVAALVQAVHRHSRQMRQMRQPSGSQAA